MWTVALTLLLIPVVWFINLINATYHSKAIMQYKPNEVACTYNPATFEAELG